MMRINFTDDRHPTYFLEDDLFRRVASIETDDKVITEAVARAILFNVGVMINTVKKEGPEVAAKMRVVK